MSDRQNKLKDLLIKAANSEHGMVLEVLSSNLMDRKTAIAALNAAKRDLIPEIPSIINLSVQAHPGNPAEIAILNIKPPEEIEE